MFFLHINDILDIEYEIRCFVSDCDRYCEIKDIKDAYIESFGGYLAFRQLGRKFGTRFQTVKCKMQLIIRRNKSHASFTNYTRGYSSLEF